MFFAGLAVYAVGAWVFVRGIMDATDGDTDPSARVLIVTVLLLPRDNPKVTQSE